MVSPDVTESEPSVPEGVRKVPVLKAVDARPKSGSRVEDRILYGRFGRKYRC